MLATALTTIYATQPVPQTITAHEFDVVDNSGKVRVSMNLSAEDASAIALYDAQGIPHVQMIVAPFDSHPLIGLSDAEGASAEIALHRGGSPNITLKDANGFEMDLGSTATVNAKTGTSEKTSAASITMFGSDREHHVIWQAP